MSRRRKQRRDRPGQTAVGVAWYGPEQWSRLRKVADDPEALEETYAEWLAVAENAIRDLKKAGVSIEKVPIDTEELVAWCNANGRSINGEARAAFAGELLQRKHEAS